ncbi:ATP-binding protein [Macrococcus armenti]|uniref:ATP-binding protein n=1 Tax=Macrococcus armenti TaxID=2875764 RepID=UPI001CCBCDA3|nr:AAA family ATPase [Macrococcus armenti]UBH14908.1 AAA family ATPase [Macrococcus armenti]UBH17268.1 AAA family ATPase [Macrococcus armenti]UBH19533.1 AAA family ATPase [Macrococcus armenti]
MKIKSLEIYGYGRLEHRNFQFNHDFVQIFGENEAGKSTMQAFIHALLFGFPKEGEYEPRLEPRFAPQYGGNIELEHIDGTTIKIERVFVHGKEKVKVVHDDIEKPIEWFNQIMNYMTKDTYKSIFSFDVLGLQEVHRKLTQEKLEAYLLQAGSFGSTEFTDLQSTIKEEQAHLFNTDEDTGIVFEKAKELQHLEAEIRSQDDVKAHYAQMYDTHQKDSRRVEHIELQLKELEEVKGHKEREIAHQKDAQEWKALELKLNIAPPQFPEQGINRFEALKHQAQNLSKDLELREEKLNQVTSEMDAIELLPDYLIEASRDVIKREQPIKQLHGDVRGVTQQRDTLTTEMNTLMQDIGWQKFETVKLSQKVQTDIAEAINKLEKQELERTQINRELQFVTLNVDRLSNESKALNKEKVHDERFNKAQELHDQRKALESKSKLFKKLSKEATAFETRELNKHKLQQTIFVITAIISLAALIYSFMNALWIPGSIFSVVCVIALLMVIFNKKPDVRFNDELTEEVKQLEDNIYKLEHDFDLSFDLNDQKVLRDKLLNVNVQLNREQSQKEALQEHLETTQKEIEATHKVLIQHKTALKIQSNYPNNRLTSAYRAIHKLVRIHDEILKCDAKIEEMKGRLDTFEQSILTLIPKLPVKTEAASIFHDLKNMLTTDEKEKFQYSKNADKRDLLKKEIEIINAAMQQNIDEQHALFEEAEVEDISSYYAKEAAYVSYHTNLERFNDLSELLRNQAFTYEDNTNLAEVPEAILNDQLLDIKTHIKSLVDERSNIQQHLNELERAMQQICEDDTLSKLKFEYEIKKNQFNKLVETYLSVNYIDTLIQAHINEVREERMPFVIDDAAEIFTYLTEGRYTKIIYDEHLTTVAADGQVYHPTELSQSTKELLYIALRLSLIHSLRRYYPFPIIIDDAFVHFDKNRRERILEYMLKQQHNQIIYYTCNRSSTINSKQTIVLERNKKEVK